MEILSCYQLNDANMSWMDDAACMDSGIDFFPEDGSHAAFKKAIDTCNGCPVRERCLQFAMDNNIMYGVWGGKTPANRATLRRYQYKHIRNGRIYTPKNSTVLP